MSTVVNEENLMTNQWQNLDESWTSIVYVLLPLQCGVILELIEICSGVLMYTPFHLFI